MNSELIAELEETKAVLMERGWTHGRLVEPTGEVCLLGAAGLVNGLTVYELSNTERGFSNASPLIGALRQVAVTRLSHELPSAGVEPIWRYNDTKAQFEGGMNAVIALIDEAIIAEKEKS